MSLGHTWRRIGLGLSTNSRRSVVISGSPTSALSNRTNPHRPSFILTPVGVVVDGHFDEIVVSRFKEVLRENRNFDVSVVIVLLTTLEKERTAEMVKYISSSIELGPSIRNRRW